MQGKIINGFELKRLLGMGGMAEVWYAENEIGKSVAVKILKEDLSHNNTIVERFRNEAMVMVKLDHPNIRQVYAYSNIEERPCILMEYLDGDDLKALMKQGRRFTDEELRKWWDEIADALNYTHAEGIVHRDIKPSNLFLDKRGNIKLLDFGIAKIKESISMTETGATMGTLMYMSPEQVDDAKHLGPESDVYSLAVTFVHLLSGKAPYDSSTMSDYKIRKSIVEQPLDLSMLPVDWNGFLAPYLEKDPAKRPALKAFKAVPQTEKPETSSDLSRGKGNLRSSLDDEGTIVAASISEPSREETIPNENTHVESVPLAPGQNDKPKSKKGLWISLVAVAIVALIVLLVWPRRSVHMDDGQDELIQIETAEQSSCVSGSYNGHDFVDLGLPSGTLWATCNVGANNPEDYGNYYAWGEIEPKSEYSWNTYKYANNDILHLTKYCNNSDFGNNGFTDNLTVLQSADDVASVNWGSGWQMPTKSQWEELKQNTTSTWATQNDVEGWHFSASNGNSLFLPAAGIRCEGSLNNSNLNYESSIGSYWSSMLYTDYGSVSWSWCFLFNKMDCFVMYSDRSGGGSVRPVRLVN